MIPPIGYIQMVKKINTAVTFISNTQKITGWMDTVLSYGANDSGVMQNRSLKFRSLSFTTYFLPLHRLGKNIVGNTCFFDAIP